MKKHLIVLLIFALGNNLYAQITLHSSSQRQVIGSQTWFLRDSTKEGMTLKEIIKADSLGEFVKNNSSVPNFGFSQSAYWARFDVTNYDTTTHPYRWLLEVGFGNMAFVDLYTFDTQKHVLHTKAGDYLGKEGRKFDHFGYIFDLPIPPKETKRVYIRFQPYSGQALFPLVIWQKDAFFNTNQTISLIWGGYIGILLVVLLYHLVLALVTKEKGFAKLTAYLLTYLGFELARGFGLGPRYLWYDSIFFTTYAAYIFSTISLLLFLDFYNYATQVSESNPRLRIIIRITQGVCLVLGLTAFFYHNIGQNQLMSLQALVVGLVVLTTAIRSVWQGNKTAWFYLLAIASIYIGTMVQSAQRAGLFRVYESLLTRYAINIGSLIEILLLSLGVAYTVRAERAKRQAVEEQARLEQQNRHQAIEEAELKGKKEEMQRVSNDLHNRLGNTLLALRSTLKTLQGELQGNIEQKWLIESMDLVQETYNQIRELSYGYSPKILEKEGLFGALTQLIERFNRIQKQTIFYLSVSGSETLLGNKHPLEIYQLCLELINNILKHSEASEASIRIHITDYSSSIIAIDNGIGLKKHVSSSASFPKMYDHISRLEGTLVVRTSEEIGLKVEITLPH